MTCLARHVPSPRHHPLGAVSECSDNIVAQDKERKRPRGPLCSATQINTRLSRPRCHGSVARMVVFSGGKRRFTSKTRHSSLLLFGKTNPRRAANTNLPGAV